MIETISRRQLIGAATTALGAGIVLAGCAGDSDSAATSAPGTTRDTGGVAPPETQSPVDTTTATTTTAAPATAATVGAEDSTTTAAGPASTDASSFTSGTPAATVFTAEDFATLGTCLVLPELTAGPYPSIDLIERRDITEGMTGHPLRVGIQVVDESCSPIAGARVEIWHCDVDGDYSSYDDGGTADDAAEGTEQIMSQGVYAEFGPPDRTNAEDRVTSGAADASAMIMTATEDVDIAGTRALIVVGVDPSATR